MMKSQDTPARRVACTLSAMAGRGSIAEIHVDAGKLFQSQHDQAHASAGVMRYDAIADRANGIRPSDVPRTSSSRAGARARFDDAMRALGGHDSASGKVAYWVLGRGETLKEYARWTGANKDHAAAHLVAALGILVAHYWPEEVRLTPDVRPNPEADIEGVAVRTY